MIISTIAAMAAGYVLSVIFGTPKVLNAERYLKILSNSLAPKISAKYENSYEGQRTAGTVFLILLLLLTVVPAALILILLYCFFPTGAIVLDALLCWSVIDIKGKTRQASAVSRAVKANNPEKAARLASKFSGVDCTDFESENSVRATVEAVADRTVDSAAAPLFYMFLLSGVGALFWKASDAAADMSENSGLVSEAFAENLIKLKNALCFIPGKLASVIMLVDALYLKLNTRTAEKTLLRDGKKCRRACYGGCRAVLAGILGISLLPEEVYSEQFLRTYTIGETLKEPEPNDIVLSNQLMIGTAFIIMALFFIIKLTIGIYVG